MCTVKSTISTKHKIIENVVVRIIGVPDNWRADNRRTCTALRNAFCHLPTNFVARRNSKQTAVLGPGPNTSVEVAAIQPQKLLWYYHYADLGKFTTSVARRMGSDVSFRRVGVVSSAVGAQCTMHMDRARLSFLNGKIPPQQTRRRRYTPHQLSLSDRRPPPTAAEPLPCRVVDHCRDRHHQLCHRLTRPCVVFFPCYFRLVFFFFYHFIIVQLHI